MELAELNWLHWLNWIDWTELWIDCIDWIELVEFHNWSELNWIDWTGLICSAREWINSSQFNQFNSISSIHPINTYQSWEPRSVLCATGLFLRLRDCNCVFLMAVVVVARDPGRRSPKKDAEVPKNVIVIQKDCAEVPKYVPVVPKLLVFPMFVVDPNWNLTPTSQKYFRGPKASRGPLVCRLYGRSFFAPTSARRNLELWMVIN